MATKGGPRGGARARSRAELEEGASSEEETRAPNARKIRVARRRRVVEDREQQARELDARLHAWQQTMARREESETLSEGEAERQAAAMQVARTALIRYTSPLMKRTQAPLPGSVANHSPRLKKRKKCGGAVSASVRRSLLR